MKYGTENFCVISFSCVLSCSQNLVTSGYITKVLGTTVMLFICVEGVDVLNTSYLM